MRRCVSRAFPDSADRARWPNRNKERFQKVFGMYEVCYITFAFMIFSVVHFFILPFLGLYTKDVEDISYVQKNLPIMFILPSLLSAIRYPCDAMIHISGHFRQTQLSAIMESTINVLCSVIGVYFWGIYGTLLGTIISSVFRTSYLIKYVNKNLLERKCIKTYKVVITNFLLYFLILYFNRYISINLNTYWKIFMFCIPYTLCVCLLYLIGICIMYREEAILVKDIMKDCLNKGFGRRKEV